MVERTERAQRILCPDCFMLYLVRPSGSLLEGIDRTREMVRIRDKHTCRQCGKLWQYGTRRFDVHHRDGNCGRLSRSYDRVRDMDKLITLCHACHMGLDAVRERMRSKSSPRPNKPSAARGRLSTKR